MTDTRDQRPHVIVLATFDDRTQSIYCKACQQRTQDVEGPCPGRRE